MMAIPMHHTIRGRPPEGKEIDHIDGYGLNNTRRNLRFCTHQENLQNSKATATKKHFSSQYKGVYKMYRRKKDGKQTWGAVICHNDVHHNLGVFDDEIKAAKAYDHKALELFGEFARINFLQNS